MPCLRHFSFLIVPQNGADGMLRPGSAAEVGKVLFDVRPDKKRAAPRGRRPEGGRVPFRFSGGGGFSSQDGRLYRFGMKLEMSFHPKRADSGVLG